MKKEYLRLFYSYTHKDEPYRQELEAHLSVLVRKKVIHEWHDRKILPGQEWEGEIDNNIHSADIILLLISADFINSDYCISKEVSIAIDRHNSGASAVIPIVLRPCLWLETSLSKLQALPKDAKPISTWNNFDEAWLNVSQGIKDVAESIRSRNEEVSSPKNINELLETEVNRLESRFSNNRKCDGLPTGFDQLDREINGLQDDSLIMIASRSGTINSDFAINIISSLAISQNTSGGYLSMHLSEKNFTRNMLSSLSLVNKYRIAHGALEKNDWPKLTSAVHILAGKSVYFEYISQDLMSNLKTRIVHLVDKSKIRFFVIDYFDLEHTSTEVRRHIDILKTLARELKVIIIILCSLPSSVEKRVSKRPLLQDLYALGDVENIFSSILFLYKRNQDYTVDKNDYNFEIIVGSNSEGGIKVIPATYDPGCSRIFEIPTFENLEKSFVE